MESLKSITLRSIIFTPERDDEIREVLKSGKLLRIKLENDA